jgi:DNA ligase-1
MQNVLHIISEISNTSSRNEKEQILRTNKDNQLLKDVLYFVFNPYIVTGISKKKINKAVTYTGCKLNNVYEVMDYLKRNNTGSDADISAIQGFISNQPEELQEFYRQIVTKDLTIGCDVKTINKVCNNYIPTFSVMLAEPFEKFYKDVACEIKIDGTRCLTIKQGKSVNMFTRNGKLIEGFNNLLQQIGNLPVENVVLDGELIGENYTDTMNKLFRKSQGKQANYMIFDMLTFEEFQSGKSDSDYWTRKQGLISFSKNLIGDFTNLKFVEPLKVLTNATIEDLTEVMNTAVQLGFEGIMVKPLSSKYECKRSYDWQKMKPFFSDEYEIVDFEEGDGKYKGTFGKVIVNVDGVSVGVGSGFSDTNVK